MKYCKYWDEYSQIDGGYTYLEIDNGWAIRQITVNGERFLASNVYHPQWGLSLADQQINLDEIDEDIPLIFITKNEFDEVWNRHLSQHRTTWNKVRNTYKIGCKIEGAILIFFPQGVIVNLGEYALGIADYSACKASTEPEFMYPKHRVTAIVQGYDEVNQWVILESPQIHKTKIDSN